MSPEEINAYQLKVLKFLESIPYNSDKYIIDDLCKSENRVLFIETIKLYMRIHLHEYMGYLTFNDDYTYFYKTDKIYDKSNSKKQNKL